MLKLAADEGQAVVEKALEHLLAAPRLAVSAKEVKGMLDTWRDQAREWRERPPLEVCLTDYDALLDGGEDEGQEAGEAVEAVEAYPLAAAVALEALEPKDAAPAMSVMEAYPLQEVEA